MIAVLWALESESMMREARRCVVCDLSEGFVECSWMVEECLRWASKQ